MRMILALAILVGCNGDDGPMCPDKACSDDIAALYARGCSIAMPNGTKVAEPDLRAMCEMEIACGGDGCDSNLRAFDVCVGGQGLTVVCP